MWTIYVTGLRSAYVNVCNSRSPLLKKPATTPYSCHGVITDRSILSLNLSDQLQSQGWTNVDMSTCSREVVLFYPCRSLCRLQLAISLLSTGRPQWRIEIEVILIHKRYRLQYNARRAMLGYPSDSNNIFVPAKCTSKVVCLVKKMLFTYFMFHCSTYGPTFGDHDILISN